MNRITPLAVVCIGACSAIVGRLSAESIKDWLQDKSRVIGETKGAQAKEVLRVVDQDGKPVKNARIYGSFWPGDNGRKYILVDGLTNVDGEYVAEGASKWKLTYQVSKDGYYTSNGMVDYLASTNVPAVVSGKWQPYGRRMSIVIKSVENPRLLLNGSGLKSFKIPIYGAWLGFDFERYQFVAPHGEGKNPDVLLRFTLNNPSRRDYHMKMDVSFTNMPYAGAYLMKKDEFSDFKNVYHADTNANYRQTFAYSFDRYPQKRPIVCELGEDEYLVFRTRTKVDDKGRLLSANYGVLYGSWSFVGPRGMNIPYLAFNPTPNDTNLEDIGTLNKMKRMRR